MGSLYDEIGGRCMRKRNFVGAKLYILLDLFPMFQDLEYVPQALCSYLTKVLSIYIVTRTAPAYAHQQHLG